MNKPSKTKREAASQGCCLKGTPKERKIAGCTPATLYL